MTTLGERVLASPSVTAGPEPIAGWPSTRQVLVGIADRTPAGTALRKTQAAWRRRAAERRRGRDPLPSYRAKYFESRRREAYLRDTFDERHPVWAHNNKDTGRALAVSLGVPVPRMLAEVARLSELDIAALPDEFVLKPVRGTRGRACYPARREAKRYRILTTGALLSEGQIRATYEALADRGLVSRRAVVEQLLLNPERPALVAPDWRVYCFGSRVGLVAERLRLPARRQRSKTLYRYWDADWNDVGVARPLSRVDPRLPAPWHPAELHAAALAVSSHFRRPHLRVDLYDTLQGVFFGEITPNPGPSMPFTPAFDEHLGRLWEQAETEQFFRQPPPG